MGGGVSSLPAEVSLAEAKELAGAKWQPAWEEKFAEAKISKDEALKCWKESEAEAAIPDVQRAPPKARVPPDPEAMVDRVLECQEKYEALYRELRPSLAGVLGIVECTRVHPLHDLPEGSTYEAVRAQAAAAKETFEAVCGDVAEALNGVRCLNAPLKGRARIEEKTAQKYGGDYRRCVDIVRASHIAVTDPEDIAKVVEAFETDERGEVRGRRCRADAIGATHLRVGPPHQELFPEQQDAGRVSGPQDHLPHKRARVRGPGPPGKFPQPQARRARGLRVGSPVRPETRINGGARALPGPGAEDAWKGLGALPLHRNAERGFSPMLPPAPPGR